MRGVLCWQVAFTAGSACVHSKSEPGDTSARALVATLRKRLSVARDLLPPSICSVQVRHNYAISGGNLAKSKWQVPKLSGMHLCVTRQQLARLSETVQNPFLILPSAEGPAMLMQPPLKGSR